MELFETKTQCSGCTVCMHVCPEHAITMVPDNEGFLYPEVNSIKCNECGLCSELCPFRYEREKDSCLENIIVFAAKHKNKNIRISSSSGGMFSAISDYVLGNDGVIYGAAFDEKFKVIHRKAENDIERDKMKGSKYVQSYLGDTFLDVKKEVETGRYVLFSGTPCQVAGLKAYLASKKYEKLILCDFVCHGVLSPLIWMEYINLIKKKRGDLKSFNFRDKRLGWHKSTLSASFSNGLIVSNSPLINIFNDIFYQRVALRPSCHVCPFSKYERTSDITIADFWGIEKCKPHFDDNRGVSLVIINSPKGMQVFNNVKHQLEYEISNVDECVQQNLVAPSEKSPKRHLFWDDYFNHGFAYLARKYTDYGLINKLKHSIFKPVLSKFGILEIVKKLLFQKNKYIFVL